VESTLVADLGWLVFGLVSLVALGAVADLLMMASTVQVDWGSWRELSRAAAMGLWRQALARTAAQVFKRSKESCKQQMTGKCQQQMDKGKQQMQVRSSRWTCKQQMMDKGKRTGKGKQRMRCKQQMTGKGKVTCKQQMGKGKQQMTCKMTSKGKRAGKGGVTLGHGTIAREKRGRAVLTARPCRQHHQDCTRKTLQVK
jgi:membrane protein implicated in regulation of membrane protease activity